MGTIEYVQNNSEVLFYSKHLGTVVYKEYYQGWQQNKQELETEVVIQYKHAGAKWYLLSFLVKLINNDKTIQIVCLQR